MYGRAIRQQRRYKDSEGVKRHHSTRRAACKRQARGHEAFVDNGRGDCANVSDPDPIHLLRADISSAYDLQLWLQIVFAPKASARFSKVRSK